jgi:hypothetical protein
MSGAAFITRYTANGVTREYHGLAPAIRAMSYRDALDCLNQAYWGSETDIPPSMTRRAATIIADHNDVDLCTHDGDCCDGDCGCAAASQGPPEPSFDENRLEVALSEARRGNLAEALIQLSYGLDEIPTVTTTLDLIRSKIA